jgi:hypothetical protein
LCSTPKTKRHSRNRNRIISQSFALSYIQRNKANTSSSHKATHKATFRAQTHITELLRVLQKKLPQNALKKARIRPTGEV